MNLAGVRAAVASAWQEEFIQDYVNELAQAKDAFANQLRLAESIG